MSKRNYNQKPEAASVVVTTKSVRAKKPRHVPVTSAGARRAKPPSKSGRILALLRQAEGATLDQLMKITKWQAHSVRGFLSGAVRKRKGLTVLSERDGEGLRRYRIDAGAGA